MNSERDVPSRSEIRQFIEAKRAEKGIPDHVKDRAEGRGRAAEFIEMADIKSSFPKLDDESAEKIMQDLTSYDRKTYTYPLRYV